ncbi:Leucine-rich repeat and transmembrane domain-containing protein 2 [Echinococcus granulosus]|uniref:Leucine-rich repeat and transmembrane domain-containing protein 2 n=1 Tax=Echinococcus granulosus TaxID=6210 RepID=W6USZ8_ECHGR|nr:Leucine-rich repeat and transmembrane domain-containing protein 2 [Echinococcus granulosus]EUB61442.1 Leucine-rich repeat and transmembrane domain-containing protein 2 [Echinococcus granulosus]
MCALGKPTNAMNQRLGIVLLITNSLLLFILPLVVVPLNTSRQHFTLWNLHGAQNFYPCQFIRASSDSDNVDTIECDRKASAILGNSIPTIYPEGRVVKEIRIFAERQLSRISRKAFERAGANLQKLVIEGGEIRVIRREALLGLTELQVLEIRNAQSVEKRWSNNGLAGRLFTADGELKYLKKLKRLVLENVDLSDGLVAYAFYDISRHLTEVEMIGNNLVTINPYTFEKSECCKSLRRLRLERQNGYLNWLNNAYRWARDLGGITLLSLSGNNMTNKTLDFGYSLNSKLRALKIENCSLIELSENLLSNFKALEEIYAGENSFTIISDQEATETLRGLRRFTNLSKLSLHGNRGLIYKQPTWFRASNIKELDYTKSLLRRIGARELPKGLQQLHLESTFLEEIDPEWAAGMTSFSHLYLNASYLKTVKINGVEGNWQAALEALKDQLKVLGLSRCQIIGQSLQLNMDDEFQITGLRLGLNQLQRLEHLDLSGNYITHIPQDAFQNLSQLISLNLSNNHLQTLLILKHDVIRSTSSPSIQDLDLTNNALSTVLRSPPSLGFNTSLQNLLADGAKVKLRGNPLICDCRLRWLAGKRIRVDNFTCTGKNSIAGSGFQRVTVEDLENGNNCMERDFIGMPDSTYPFRPVRVFGYDRNLEKVYFAVKGRTLKSAWSNIARTAPQHPAFALQKVLAKLSNMTPEIISSLQESYLVFEVAYWPVGQMKELQGPLEWQVVEEGLMRTEGREYIFSVQPIDVKRAHTICFRNALERRNTASSTLCQIFQPSELTMTASANVSVNRMDHVHAPLWFVILATAGAVIFITCILWLCVRYICCRRKRIERRQKRETSFTMASNEPLRYTDYELQKESTYDKLENYCMENSLPNLNTVDGRPELPKRAKRYRTLTQPLQTGTGSLGDLTGMQCYVRTKVQTHQSLVTRRLNERNSTAKLLLAGPKLPRPITYQHPKIVPTQLLIDENGYVRMNVESDEHFETGPEKRIRRQEENDEKMIDSYTLGVSRGALMRQKSAPAYASTASTPGAWTSPEPPL